MGKESQLVKKDPGDKIFLRLSTDNKEFARTDFPFSTMFLGGSGWGAVRVPLVSFFTGLQLYVLKSKIIAVEP